MRRTGEVGPLPNLAKLASRLLATPEVNVVGFGFLLHTPWELWLTGRGPSSHLAVTGELAAAISVAAAVHAAIALVAFWIVAGAGGGRRWVRSSSREGATVFVFASVLLTLIVESLATGVLTGWEHATFIPTVVEPGLAYASLGQFVTVPLLLLGILTRQLRHSTEDGDGSTGPTRERL